MHKFFVGIFLSLMVTACGRPSSNKTALESVVSTSYTNEPLFLKKQSTECSSKKFDGDINYSLYLHLNGQDTFERVDFTQLITQLFLRDNEIISQSFYGGKVELLTSSRGTRTTTQVNPISVTLCPEEDHYAQGTVESAALNAAHIIKKTQISFKQAVRGIEIAPVTINISPAIIESTISTNEIGENVKTSRYWTDNALYSPYSKSITFLPHSQEIRSQGLTVNFWEVPMIASHEYGHHLFQTLYTSKTSPVHSIGCFDHVKKKARITNKSSGWRIVKIENVMTAYNEGFADLIAYYTLGAEERSVKGIMCLDVTRDVGSSTLINGKSKVLSNSVIETFFSWSEEMSSCEFPSYQEVHIFGAVIAHSMDRFMSEFTSSDKEKIQNLVSWVKYLNSNQSRLHRLHSTVFLTKTMEAFINNSLRRFNQPTDANTCLLVRKHFPGIDLPECTGK